MGRDPFDKTKLTKITLRRYNGMINMINVTTVRIVLLLLYLSTTSALQCYSCQNVPEKRDCRRLVTCGAHQTCYTNRVIDGTKSPMYNLGCEDQYACSQHSQSALGKREGNPANPELTDGKSDQKRSVQTTCFQCCNNTDGCNFNICGTVTTTTRRCLSCRDVMKTDDCDQIMECARDEFCYVHKGSSQNIASFESRYDLGCMGAMQCNALKLVYPKSCVACCNHTDFCNYDVCNGWTPPSRQLPTTSTTTATVSTRTPPSIAINGPSKDHYMKRIVLTCVTVPPAQSYTWKFNGIVTLPKGVTVHQVTTYSGSVAGLSTLLIANLSASEKGIYTCVANINGQTVERSHSLGIISEKPAVHIVKSPVTRSFSLQCQVTGYPVPHISWDFIPDTVSVHGIPPGVAMNNEVLKSTLFVQHYQPSEYMGTWYCKAYNPVGSAMAHIHVP